MAMSAAVSSMTDPVMTQWTCVCSCRHMYDVGSLGQRDSDLLNNCLEEIRREFGGNAAEDKQASARQPCA